MYKVFGSLFDNVKQDDELSQLLTKYPMVIEFNYKDPEGIITIDLANKAVNYHFGKNGNKPDVRFFQSADVAHLFWMGKINVPIAIATRKIIARGSVPKALKLLPAIKPVFSLYPRVLQKIGEQDLVEIKKPQKKRKKMWSFRSDKRGQKINLKNINENIIPLVDKINRLDTKFRNQNLPGQKRQLEKEMLKRMLIIRAFENRLAEEFEKGVIPSEALHLSIGQEACAVGAGFALNSNDYMTTTHRGHGHMLAKGAILKEIAAELYGKATGQCRGLGGCMHFTDAKIGALGANGIVGASSLLAIGAAMSAKKRKSSQVALAFLGDGSTAQGMFHEAMNFAAVFQLPVIFFVENNQFAISTPAKFHTHLDRIADRAKGYGIKGITINGNNVLEVYEAVRKAAAEARKKGTPILIEAITYRHCGHSEGEAFVYRSETEMNSWKKKDPISLFKKALMKKKGITTSGIEIIENQVQKEINHAFDFAEESEEPSFEILKENFFTPEPKYLYQQENKQLKMKSEEITVAQALYEAMEEELARDKRVYLIGEEVQRGGYFSVTAGLVDRFGKDRIIDTPISEYAIVGSAVGAAMSGMRPVAEIQFSDFLTCCMDPLVNQAAKLRFMSGGQYSVPLVVRTPGGAGIGMAAQHSQSWESWLLQIPGLIVMAPSTPYDAKGLLKAAIRSNNPVVFFENKLLYATTGEVPAEDYVVPIGKADIKRRGSDLTIVAVGAMVQLALTAAEQLADDGVDVEIVDPRTLNPCDWQTIMQSAAKTRKVLVLEEGTLTCGFGAECSAKINQHLWKQLKAPVKRVAALDMPIPYNRTLENMVVPNLERLVEECLSLR